MAGSERDEEIILSKFYSTDALENIESKLALRPTLRIHILGAIATGIVSTYSEVKSFLEQSFYGQIHPQVKMSQTYCAVLPAITAPSSEDQP